MAKLGHIESPAFIISHCKISLKSDAQPTKRRYFTMDGFPRLDKGIALMVRSDAAVSSDLMPVGCAFLHANAGVLSAMIGLVLIVDCVLLTRCSYASRLR